MSSVNFNQNNKLRNEAFLAVFQQVIKNDNVAVTINNNLEFLNSCTPHEIVNLVDTLVSMQIPIDELKKGVNKFLNLTHKALSKIESPEYTGFLGCMAVNNRLLEEKLNQIKPLIKSINKDSLNNEIISLLFEKFTEIGKYSTYYEIKENVLFPVIERNIPEFRCVQVMWSFHDDIKKNLKSIIQLLHPDSFNLKVFNRLAGDLFFNMLAIKFREEKILYPVLLEYIPETKLNSLLSESLEIGFPFYQPTLNELQNSEHQQQENELDLETGFLSVEQIKLIFNHLPVDITFVDENNKVRYFSTPPNRIFRRTKSVIGRDVHNCHPPESVHVVEQIVEAFRTGKKNEASFWINMKGKMYMIQYFAVRDTEGNYRGVVEVSQEITNIQQLEGEKRLLDWE